jgi:hypothetical protein
MKRIIVGAALGLGALAVVASPATADTRKKQVRSLETQRASSPARLASDANTRASTSGYRVGQDGRAEFCVGF